MATTDNGQRPGILVVDDDPSILRMLRAALPQLGYAAYLAENGREAREVFRRAHDHITLVLLDVRMPDLDGPATLAALRDLDPHVRCCFLSGESGDYSEEQLRALDALVLHKPFTSASL